MRRPEATTTPVSVAPKERWMVILRYFDVVAVAIATVPALVLGAPALGYLIGAISWVAQRALAQLDRRLIRRSVAARTQFGVTLFEAFGRIWLLAGAIVAAGVIGGRADGLAAALTIFGAYSIAFAIKVMSGRPPAPPRPASPARSSTSPQGASR